MKQWRVYISCNNGSRSVGHYLKAHSNDNDLWFQNVSYDYSPVGLHKKQHRTVRRDHYKPRAHPRSCPCRTPAHRGGGRFRRVCFGQKSPSFVFLIPVCLPKLNFWFKFCGSVPPWGATRPFQVCNKSSTRVCILNPSKGKHLTPSVGCWCMCVWCTCVWQNIFHDANIYGLFNLLL